MSSTQTQGRSPDIGTWLRLMVGIVAPFIALALQSTLSVHATFLFFYPAVVISFWIGGLRAGVLATVISATAALWYFIPPEHSFVKPIEFYVLPAVFLTMGGLFAVFHERLRRANRKIEEALSASEQMNEKLKRVLNERRIFAALIENSSDFIGIADASGKPVYINPAGRRLIGQAPDYPIEKTQIPEYYPPDQREFACEVILKSMIQQGRWEGETHFRHWQTGQPIPVSDTHFMIHDPENGEIIGMGTVTRDITARKKLEGELRRAVQARDEVLGIVAHDLRNPLTSIGMVARGLAIDPNSKSQKYGQMLNRSVSRMNCLIKNLLDVTRIESGHLEIERECVPPGQVLTEILESQGPLANSATLELRLNVAQDLPDIWVDRARLLQVFENLIGNALKFTAPGGCITIGAARRDGDVLFWVGDTGKGISAENIPHLFDRFWQAQKDKRQGTGLGLAITKGIVEAHGGKISVESTTAGTTFSFTIPICEGKAGSTPEASNKAMLSSN